MKRFVLPLVAVVVLSFYSCNKCQECTLKNAEGEALGMYKACGDDPESESVENFCTSCTDEEKKKMTADCGVSN